jgi:hypothetical protein
MFVRLLLLEQNLVVLWIDSDTPTTWQHACDIVRGDEIEGRGNIGSARLVFAFQCKIKDYLQVYSLSWNVRSGLHYLPAGTVSCGTLWISFADSSRWLERCLLDWSSSQQGLARERLFVFRCVTILTGRNGERCKAPEMASSLAHFLPIHFRSCHPEADELCRSEQEKV